MADPSQDQNEYQFQQYFQNAMSRTYTFQMMAKQDNYGVSVCDVHLLRA